MPIIVLSALGILGTIISVNILMKAERRANDERAGTMFAIGTLLAKEPPLYHEILPVAADAAPAWITEANALFASQIPEVQQAQSFIDVTGVGEQRRFVMPWLTKDGKEFVFGAWPEDFEGSQNDLDKSTIALVMSINKDGQLFVSRGDGEAPELPGWVLETHLITEEKFNFKKLLEYHREVLDDQELVELRLTEAQATYERYFLDYTTWLVKRGGYKSLGIGVAISDPKVQPIALGMRETWSTQLEPMIFKLAAAQSAELSDASSQSHLIVHGLTNPISLVNSMKHELGTVTRIDLSSAAEVGSPDNFDNYNQMLIKKKLDDGSIKQVFQMQSPFAATIYEVIKK